MQEDDLGSGATHSSERNLELTGLTTGVLVLLAALWSLLGHHLSSHSRYLNESGTACLLGLAAGVVLLACRDHSNAGLVDGLLHFNSAAFFTYLLPPVIFYAGLSVEQRLFFSNLPSILSFGVLGTLVSFALIAAALYSLAGTTFGMDAKDCLALGAVFAATDSVAVLGLLDARSAPQLFSLVFGEGIVNDATSVVLLGALARMARQQAGGVHGSLAADPGGAFPGQDGTRSDGLGDDSGADAGGSVLLLVWRLMLNFGYLLLTSTILGVAAGMGIASLLRHRVASQGPHHEVAVVGLLSYLAYLAAELLGLSAILSLFCCGATVSRFALRNGTVSLAPSLDPSTHGGHAVSDPGGTGGGVGTDISLSVRVHGNERRAGGNGPTVVASGAVAESPRDADGPRQWFTEHGDSTIRGEDGVRCGAGGSGVLRALTAPAKRLAARAFGSGTGTGAGCMSSAGASTTINAFRSLSYVAEGLIFVYLGMDCLDPVRWEASYVGEVLWLVGLLLFFLLAARAASVVPLSMLHNLYAPRPQRLSGRDMLVIWWSGLMRGAVSVALVYLNFDTADGSRPATAVIISPHVSNSGTSAHTRVHPPLGVSAHPGLRRHLLLQEAVSAAAAAGPETDASNPDEIAATAVAAALAEASEIRSRQHATLIVATLLVVVASVLVVSTLTKPVLQAALEADPRKPPLKVLAEALFDPWLEATWRLQVALGRSYRRLTATGGGFQDGAAEEGDSFAASASGGAAAPAGGSGPSRRAATPAPAVAFSSTHTIPMATLGHNGCVLGSSLGASISANTGSIVAGAAADGPVGRSLSAAAPDMGTQHMFGKGGSGQQGQAPGTTPGASQGSSSVVQVRSGREVNTSLGADSKVGGTGAGGMYGWAERARLRVIGNRKFSYVPPPAGKDGETAAEEPGDGDAGGDNGDGAGAGGSVSRRAP